MVKYAKTERDVLTYANHPFIVGMRFAFQTPEKLFMVLDYAAGGNMSRALHKERKFTEEKAAMYLAEILLALEDLHKRDVIYRDLKPDNIVLELGGNIGRNSCIIASLLNNSNNLLVFESDPDNAKKLKENCDLNNLNFIIEDCAISKIELLQKDWITKS